MGPIPLLVEQDRAPIPVNDGTDGNPFGKSYPSAPVQPSELNMKATSTTRWRIPPWAWLIIGPALLAEMGTNALRAYLLGSHVGHNVVIPYLTVPVSLAGALLVLAAIGVSASQSRAAWVALTPGVARQRVVAGLLAVLLLAVSIAAMGQHILSAQRGQAGGETGDRTAYTIAKTAYDKAKAESDRLGAGRTTDEVRGAMEKVRVPKWAWAGTRECTARASDMTADEATACKPILDLRLEMANAIARDRAKDTLDAATAELGALPVPPEQASALEATVAFWWAWVMGFAVVMIATFGSVLFARVEREDTSVAAAEPAPVRLAPAPDGDGGRTLPAPEPANDDAHPVVVALRKAGRPLNNTELAEAMAVTGGEATKRRAEVEHLLAEVRAGKEVHISLREWAQRKAA